MSTNSVAIAEGATPRVQPSAAEGVAALIEMVNGLDPAAGDAVLVEWIAGLEVLNPRLLLPRPG